MAPLLQRLLQMRLTRPAVLASSRAFQISPKIKNNSNKIMACGLCVYSIMRPRRHRRPPRLGKITAAIGASRLRLSPLQRNKSRACKSCNLRPSKYRRQPIQLSVPSISKVVANRRLPQLLTKVRNRSVEARSSANRPSRRTAS